MNTRRTLLTLCAAGAWILAGSAGAQEGGSLTYPSVENFSFLYTGPRQFYLYNFTDKESYHFKTLRQVKVCNDTMEQDKTVAPNANEEQEKKEPVPLRVSDDGGNTMMVEPGKCAEFQARTVDIAPAAELERGWAIRGTIQSATPKGSRQG
jgi:hypothetical protein